MKPRKDLSLVSLISAKEEEIMDVEIFLRKSPVCGSSGELGVRLIINELDLKALKCGV